MNNKPAQKIEWLVWGGLALTIAVVGGVFLWSKLNKPKPTNDERPLPVINQISDFHLVNQDGEPVTLASLRGKVWVADIIFSRCPGACAKMTKEMAKLQSAFRPSQPVRLVSFTSDPEYDTPAVLKKYAERFGADPKCWRFVTGDKQAIRNLAVNDFKFVVVERKPEDRTVPDDLFIHSEWFALVDQQGRMRGWIDREGHQHATFESMDPEAQAQLVSAIKQLWRKPSS